MIPNIISLTLAALQPENQSQDYLGTMLTSTISHKPSPVHLQSLKSEYYGKVWYDQPPSYIFPLDGFSLCEWSHDYSSPLRALAPSLKGFLFLFIVDPCSWSSVLPHTQYFLYPLPRILDCQQTFHSHESSIGVFSQSRNKGLCLLVSLVLLRLQGFQLVLSVCSKNYDSASISCSGTSLYLFYPFVALLGLRLIAQLFIHPPP